MKFESDPLENKRKSMVKEQIENRGIEDYRVLEAMKRIPRHAFVPDNLVYRAYDDEPLPIGEEQTISQPYIVAFMTEALRLSGDEKVLEVGTGSGYQTAVLAELSELVCTIELKEALAARARLILESLGYVNIKFRISDGSLGWPEEAPFDAIMVTAAARKVPRALEEQLADGGRMILPVGSDGQELVLGRKKKGRLKYESILPVRFVPLL